MVNGKLHKQNWVIQGSSLTLDNTKALLETRLLSHQVAHSCYACRPLKNHPLPRNLQASERKKGRDSSANIFFHTVSEINTITVSQKQNDTQQLPVSKRWKKGRLGWGRNPAGTPSSPQATSQDGQRHERVSHFVLSERERITTIVLGDQVSWHGIRQHLVP